MSLATPKPKGLRFDVGKPPLDLIDPWFLIALAEVMAYGGKKYGDPLNYQKGMAPSKSAAGALRHLNAIQRGEFIDSESGCSHAAMLAWNAMVIHYTQRTGIGADLPDDRWSKKPDETVPGSPPAHPQ